MRKHKRTFLIPVLLFLLALGSTAGAQTIAAAEYFIDNDPGVGKATPLDSNDGSFNSKTETAEKTIDTSFLSVGPHLLGIRFLKSDGTWSYTRKTWFYVSGERILTGAEWFIDEDPGKGKGNTIPLPADGAWDEPQEEITLDNIDIANLNPDDPNGHTIFVRFCDSDGNWGLTRRATFEVRPDLYITKAEWTAEPSADPFAPPDTTWNPMDAEDGAFDEPEEAIVKTGLDPDAYDCIYVRVRDNLGRWSTWHGLVLNEDRDELTFDPLVAWNDGNMEPLKGFPCHYSTYADWVVLGRPGCWGIPPFGGGYQCDGDADAVDSGGLTKYRVFTGDLNLIVANWKKKTGDATLDPCADIDHKDSGGINKFRVFTGDLTRLVTNWRKKDTQLSGDCPRPE